jgi:hypothetical protein
MGVHIRWCQVLGLRECKCMAEIGVEEAEKGWAF